MKISKFTWLSLGLAVCITFAGLQSSYATETASPGPGVNATNLSSSMPKDSMSQKVKEFKKEWNKKIDQLNKKIKQDERKLKTAKTENKAKLNDQIDDMKAKRDQLKQEVAGAGNKTAAQWDDFKAQVSDQYDSLSTKVKDFFDRTF